MRDSIRLKVNEDGEEFLFFIDLASQDRNRTDQELFEVVHAKHISHMHPGAAFPERYYVGVGFAFLCNCGLRVVVPYYFNSKNELASKFARFNR